MKDRGDDCACRHTLTASSAAAKPIRRDPLPAALKIWLSRGKRKDGGENGACGHTLTASSAAAKPIRRDPLPAALKTPNLRRLQPNKHKPPISNRTMVPGSGTICAVKPKGSPPKS